MTEAVRDVDDVDVYVTQWNLDLTKCQGTGETCSLRTSAGEANRGFVISRFCSIHFYCNFDRAGE